MFEKLRAWTKIKKIINAFQCISVKEVNVWNNDDKVKMCGTFQGFKRM